MTTRYLVGDVFDRMSELEDGSVDLVLTSPPFLALRSYLPDGDPNKGKEIGSEPTPADYLDVLLRWTAECRRVLAPHGSLCVELGDSYAGSGGAGGDYDPDGLREGQPKFRQSRNGHNANTWPLAKSLVGVPQLYMLSLAYGRNILTGTESPAGMWRVRNVKPWIRTNPPVGALGDKERPATSYVIVACTSANRWFDLDAVRTPHVAPDHAPRPVSPKHDKEGNSVKKNTSDKPVGEHMYNNPAGAPPRDWWHQVDAIIDAEIDRRAGKASSNSDVGGRAKIRGGDEATTRGTQAITGGAQTIGARGVHIRRALEQAGILTTLEALDISPKGYSGAHYAVWPPELCRQLIDEMCPRRVCVECGEPSRRIVEMTEAYAEFRRRVNEGELTHVSTLDAHLAQGDDPGGRVYGAGYDPNGVAIGSPGSILRSGEKYRTVGWSDCGCPGDHWRPGLVLDPFAGSGTTLAVASGMGRDSIGIDIDPRNADLAAERVGMFLEVDERETTT